MSINTTLDRLFEVERQLPKELYYYSNIIDQRNTTFCYSSPDLYYMGEEGLYNQEVIGSIDIEGCSFFKVVDCCGNGDYFIVFNSEKSITLQEAISLGWDL